MAGMPPEAAPAAPEGGAPAPGGDQFTELVSNLSNGLTMVLDLANSASPEAAQLIQQSNDLFQQGIEMLVSGGQAPQAPQGPGAGSPEAAGAAGAVPVGPGMR